MQSVDVWFYNPEADPSGMINKIVAKLDSPFCHCEVQLNNGLAASIYMNSQASARQRNFSNPAYTRVRIPCTPANHSQATSAIAALVEAKPEFSMKGMVGSYYGENWCPDNHTFCSKLVADVLVAAKLLPPDTETATITPSGLHRMLTNSQKVTHGSGVDQQGRVEAIGFRT